MASTLMLLDESAQHLQVRLHTAAIHCFLQVMHVLEGGCLLLILSQEAGPGALCGCTLGLQRWMVSSEALAEEVCSARQLRVAGGAEAAVLHATDGSG